MTVVAFRFVIISVEEGGSRDVDDDDVGGRTIDLECPPALRLIIDAALDGGVALCSS
jgi:hypothetical protein